MHGLMENNNDNDISNLADLFDNDPNAGPAEALARRDATIAALRVRVVDLETYIDGRKLRWAALAAERKRMRADLARAGLQTGPGNDAPAAPAQSATAKRVNAILRAAHRKLTSMHTEHNRLQAELEEKNAYIDRLCGKVSTMELERAQIVNALQKQRRVIERIEAEIRSRLARVSARHRKLPQAPAMPASIHRLDEQRAKLQARIAQQTSHLTGRLTLLDTSDCGSADFVIAGQPVTIGRGANSDIQLRHASISRQHARLECGNEGVKIEDLGSKNGVFVNDLRVRCEPLNNGDIIRVGHVQFRFTAMQNEPTGHNTS